MGKYDHPINKIYRSIHPIKAKNIFVTHITRIEKSLLSEEDLIILKESVKRLKKLLLWKRKQILDIVEKSSTDRIKEFLVEVKKDSRTLLLIKQAISLEIYNKLKEDIPNYREDEICGQYRAYLMDLKRTFEGETQIVERIMIAIKPAATVEEKIKVIKELKPRILSETGEEELSGYAEAICDNWLSLYMYIQTAGKTPEILKEGTGEGPEISREEEVQVNKSEGFEPGAVEAETSELNMDKDVFFEKEKEIFRDEGLNLPDFDEEDDAFIQKLAEMEPSEEVVEEINKLPEKKKDKVVETISFDPRFDGVYQEILKTMGNIGEMIGLITNKVRELDQDQGYNASEAFLKDLLERVSKRNGKGSIVVGKINNLLANLQKTHKVSTKRLKDLKEMLNGKDIISQVEVLQETAKDKKYKGIFGAVRNLERIALENHFDEIFDNLPVEAQRVVAEGFMADLKELKEYYPFLYKKLEKKIEDIKIRYADSAETPKDVDYDLIDRVLGFADALGPEHEDSVSKISRLADEIIGGKEEKKKYTELGEMMAGDKEYTSNRLIEVLATKRDNEKINEILRLAREIDKIPDLAERINTVKFWIENGYYTGKPHLHQFLIGQLEALRKKRTREGGLIRQLFDELDSLGNVKEKIDFLEKKLEDPEYDHLKGVINNILNNIKNDISYESEHLSESFITGELEKIEKTEDQVSWIKTNKHLPAFNEYKDYMDKKEIEIEDIRAGATREKLEEDLTEKAAEKEIKRKKAKGEKVISYDNIINLTREVMKLPGKLDRKKFIKEQESLNPQPIEGLFYKQRKLLYYLLNVEPGGKPEVMLKAMAGKVLLTTDEKKEYLKILKLSRFKQGDTLLSMQGELGITDEDIAYYAAFILGNDKKTLSAKVAFFRNIIDGTIEAGRIQYQEKEGEPKSAGYEAFFKITPGTYKKILGRLQKKIEAKYENKKTSGESPGEQTGELPEEAGLPNLSATEEKAPDLEELPDEQPGEKAPDLEELPDEQPGEKAPDLEELPDEQPGEKAPGLEELPDEQPGEKAPDLEEIPDEQPGEKAPGLEELPDEQPGEKAPGLEELPDEQPGEKAPDLEEIPGESEGVGSQEPPPPSDEGRPNPRKKVRKEDIDRVYAKKKQKIDNKVKEKINLDAKEIIRDVAPEIEKNIKKTQEEFKNEPEKKFQTILKNLSGSKPEIIPELINHTIIPILTDSNDTETRDIITALNQNIFTPVMLNGSGINIKEAIEQIESLLGFGGKLMNNIGEIETIVKKMGKMREQYVNDEVTNEIYNITALKTAISSGDVNKILENLMYVEPADKIVRELESRYIKILSKNKEYKKLLDKLLLIKEFVAKSDKNPTEDDPAFDNKTREQIRRLKSLYSKGLIAMLEKEKNKTGESNNIPGAGELISSKEFINPYQILKNAARTNPELADKEVQKDLIDSTCAAGKIFTYDGKYYIGYGHLYEFISDPDTLGYPKVQLAEALLNFLPRFSSDKEKMAFLGIPEEKYEKFMNKISSWAKGRGGNDGGKSDAAQYRNIKKMKQMSKEKKAQEAKEKKQTKQRRENRKKSRTTDRKKAAKKIIVKNKSLLKKLSQMITAKLLFLIKEYNSKKMLGMLFKSYLKPGAAPKNLFMLIDKEKYQTLYDSIADDKNLHNQLYFNKNAVLKAYNKKLKKVKE